MRIAISGKKGAGKSTLTNMLQGQYGGVVYSFASPFKAWLDDAWHDGSLRDTYPAFYRAACQNIGKGARDIFSDIWVNALLQQVENESCNIYVDDMRFPNEAEGLRRAGFYLVRLEVPEEIRLQRRPEGGDGHETEMALDDYDAFDLVMYLDDGQITDEMVEQLIRHYNYYPWRGDLATKVVPYELTQSARQRRARA